MFCKKRKCCLVYLTYNTTLIFMIRLKKLFMHLALMNLLFVMVINITINKTFSIHDSLKNYSCCNVFNQKGVNTFNVLTFIQVCTNKNKFTQIRNIDTFNVLTFIQARTVKNKFMHVKNWKVRTYFHKWFVWTFDFLEVNKITTKFLTCLKSSKQSFKKRYLCMLKHEDWE